jgi:hypothetical protein
MDRYAQMMKTKNNRILYYSLIKPRIPAQTVLANAPFFDRSNAFESP